MVLTGELVDRFADDARTCEDQLKALRLDWATAYKAIELRALGVPDDEVAALFDGDDAAVKGNIDSAFDAEFAAVKALADHHKVKVTDLTMPECADVARAAHPDLNIACYDRDHAVAVNARSRRSVRDVPADPSDEAPARGRKRSGRGDQHDEDAAPSRTRKRTKS